MNYVNAKMLDKIIQEAFDEDIGKGDITTRLFTPLKAKTKAVIIAKESGVVCGLEIAGCVFSALDKKIKFRPYFKDGATVRKGDKLAELYGRAASILTAERTALNFLSMLSGIASQTRKFVEKTEGYHVYITDTRKTIPGLRILEKYAVRRGGGRNHRMRLDEMVMVKDNHLKFIGFKNITRKIPRKIKVEVEVETLSEFKKALETKPDIIMLDNMNISEIKKAVRLRGKARKPLLEISGGVTLDNIRKFARTGADYISIGTLTKDIKSLDISLEIIT